MSRLIVYPGSRAIRESLLLWRQEGGLPPRLMRMDEFLSRLILVPGRAMVQGTQRIFLLREAAEFTAFDRVMKERDMIRFFTRSKDFFRFFEELAWERVDLSTLEEADAYAEYGEHLQILGELRNRYAAILEREGLYDRMFLPDIYQFNNTFVRRFETIELHLEGYLTRYEMELLSAVAERTDLIVHWRTTPFNEKMRLRFSDLGIELPADGSLIFSWSKKNILEKEIKPLKIDARVLTVGERYEQVAVALAEIDGMVRRGIAPERIALVLPREEFKYAFALYDRMGNLNFSMGFDLKDRPEYRVPEALAKWWQSGDPGVREWLKVLGMEQIPEIDPSLQTECAEFFYIFEQMEMAGFIAADSNEQREVTSAERDALSELRHRFCRLYTGRKFRIREWIFLWLKELEELRLDDIRGGKVTVMGVLETRGVAFDGVVIVDFNDGIVPAMSGKDRFLNSQVRKFAGLPDRQDREALQKHYYARLLERAQESVILYSRSENRLPSRFLYELGLEEGEEQVAPRELFYLSVSRNAVEENPVVETFDPLSIQWSASMLKSWLDCRRHFYYRYIRKLEDKPSKDINEGAVLHSILEELYREHDHFDEAEDMRWELEHSIGRVFGSEELKGLYLQSYWKRRLSSFIENEIRHFSVGWRVEAREMIVEGVVEGFHFRGRIDRLDRRGDEYMALDYKSGSIRESNRQNNLEKLTDFQMSIYRILLRPIYPRIQLAYVPVLDGGGYVTPAAMEEKEQLLLEHLETLRQTDSFAAVRTDELSRCRYCPYQLLCERGEYM